MLVGVEPVLQVGDLGQDDAVLLEKFGVLGGEFVEAMLVVGLVLCDAGVGGDQFLNRVTNCRGLGADSVGLKSQVSGVEFCK